MTTRHVLRSLAILGWLSIPALMSGRDVSADSSCARCPGDLNGDNKVTVDELVKAVNAALYGCPTPGPSANAVLLQTGETQCDQGSGVLGTCPGSPSGQDGSVGAGVPFDYTDNGDGTITDAWTGLMWEKLSFDGSIHDWGQTYTWADAFQTKIAALNTAPCFAGHCDWRLPNRRELESLVDAGATHPSIDSAFNSGNISCTCSSGCTVQQCSCTQCDYYWSSTTYEDVPTNAWTVNFDVGDVNGFLKTIPAYYVRAVRGGV